MQRIVFTRSRRPSRERAAAVGRRTRRRSRPAANAACYDDPSQAFAWLDASSGPQAELADDVMDAMRALRAADVLRQRGTVLRTSGGFELCMDAETARAVCTLRSAAGDAAYVITYDDERGAGEANIRVAFVTPRGAPAHRVPPRRASAARRPRVARPRVSPASSWTSWRTSSRPSAARPSGAGWRHPSRSIDDMQIQLERPGRPARDSPTTSPTCVAERDPSLARRLVAVANVEGAAPDERRRFYAAEPMDAFGPEADEVIRRMADHGVVRCGARSGGGVLRGRPGDRPTG